MPEEKGKLLSKENKEVIEAGIRNADSARKIAKRINVAASTVTREVKAIARRAALHARNARPGSRPARTARPATASIPAQTTSARRARQLSLGPASVRKGARRGPVAPIRSAPTTRETPMPPIAKGSSPPERESISTLRALRL